MFKNTSLIGIGIIPIFTSKTPKNFSFSQQILLAPKNRNIYLKKFNSKSNNQSKLISNVTYFSNLKVLTKLCTLGFNFINFNDLKYQYPTNPLFEHNKKLFYVNNFSQTNPILIPKISSLYNLLTYLSLYVALNIKK